MGCLIVDASWAAGSAAPLGVDGECINNGAFNVTSLQLSVVDAIIVLAIIKPVQARPRALSRACRAFPIRMQATVASEPACAATGDRNRRRLASSPAALALQHERNQEKP